MGKLLFNIVFQIPEASVDLTDYAERVRDGFAGNPLLPNPPLPLSKLDDDIKAFDEAHKKVTAGTGTSAQRAVPEQQLRNDLEAYGGYVQQVARTLPFAEASALVLSLGMAPRKAMKRSQRDFEAKSVGVGAVRVNVKASKRRATYYWQYSLDGLTWVSVPETLRASTTISGLEQYKRVQFRYRVLTPSGLGDWSAPLTFTVL